MTRLVCIVEGDGEVEALPLLLRRIAPALDLGYPEIPYPIRIRRGSFLAVEGDAYRAKYLALARAQAGNEEAVLVLIDADEDCPAQLANTWSAALAALAAPRTTAFVVAKTEFEGWFLAATGSISGKRGLKENLDEPADPEGVHDAKGWLRHRMTTGNTYSQTVDQPALAAQFDWKTARKRAPSLDKLCREVIRLLS